MYCPKCGAQAADETKYCRACGQSLTLVSQAILMKSLPADDKDQQKLEKAIKNISLGIGFLIISMVLAFGPMPRNWALFFSMLIAAMIPLSIGVAGILGRAISRSRSTSSIDPATVKETAPILGELPPRDAAGDLVGLTPASGVTEVTTRNLEVGAERSRDK